MASPNTHPIAGDTCNLSINALRTQRQIIARAAFEEEKSMGQFLREVIELGLKAKSKAIASAWHSERVRRFSQGANLCVFGSLVVWQSIFGEFDNYRRTAPRSSRTRTTQTARGSRRHE